MATATQIKEFIQKLGTLAVKEANNRIAQGKGFVLPSVCIAQSAIETGWGTAGIMTRANAFFGIKAGGSWTGAVYRADTWEVANGEAYNTTANFRAYDSLEASVRDYFDLIGNSTRYSNSLSYGSNMSLWKTPRECIHAIWSGGYATDTLYVEKIMNTINARNLVQYDAMITGEASAYLPDMSKAYTIADMRQGTLKVIDSGRAIENDETVLTAIALDWNKRFKASTDESFRLVTNYGPIYLARLNGDVAVIEGPYESGATVQVYGDEEIGFYYQSSNEALIERYDDFIVTLESLTLPSGEETYSSELAFFVEVK